MAHWNYRLVRTVYNAGHPELEETFYQIHEAYYNDAGEVCNLTVEPVTVTAESPEGARWVLERMLEALAKPTLDADMKFAPRD